MKKQKALEGTLFWLNSEINDEDSFISHMTFAELYGLMGSVESCFGKKLKLCVKLVDKHEGKTAKEDVDTE